MRRTVCMMLAFLFVIPGLMITASCSKKKIKHDEEPFVQYDEPLRRGIPDVSSVGDEEARKRAIEEERLRQEQLRREREARMGAATTSAVPSAGTGYQGSAGTSAYAREVMDDDVHFAFDSAVLSGEAQEKLRQKAEWLRGNPAVSLVIEGHCDERGTNEYNMALGDRRAGSVKSFLMSLGISPARMTGISYGEERPADPRHNEAAWARNRRAHFVPE